MKKKVLIGYIGDGHAGGVDKYILNLVSSVQKELYEIDLLTNRLNLELYEKLKKHNINLYEIPTLKHPIKQYKSIKRIIDKNKYDVTYFNISTAIHCIGLLAAKRCKVANRVVHSHSSGIDMENKYKRCIMTLIHSVGKKIVSGSATTFIACSQKAGEWMCTPNILKGTNYFVVHNSVDLKKFVFDEGIRKTMREKMDWTNKKVLIHVANFTHQKNNEFMIEVFKKAREVQHNLVLVLIGKGNKEQKIRTMVKDYGLCENVLFLKDISNVNDYLQAADLFLLPSFFEGYPISALEAQVCGLPCILSDKITSESKIAENCVFMPLEIKTWVEQILCVQENKGRKAQSNIKEFDNSELSSKIEKLWCRQTGEA
ncbi:MAG: glycosyltransferase [Tyzzerella sp.]|nr:glycosyltransferase [Tyzzerella sp.]